MSLAVKALLDLVERLRSPGGCPWDAKQTDSTIKQYLLEEAYEVLDAIEKSSPSDVCEELGDLLFHIIFLARLASERQEFDFVDVVENITRKMIRRHPHVFGETRVNNAEEVVENWAVIKKREKVNAVDASALDGIPQDLPALMKTHRLGERASRIGFGCNNTASSWNEVAEKFSGLAAAVADGDRVFVGQKIGEVLFCLAGLSRKWGHNSEHLLRVQNRRFSDQVAEHEKGLNRIENDLKSQK
ncbi:Phosphoribosyl-ATP diphosphatase [uncultured Desulfobacterium sp.]|uniref:Phosphoribosyl-ATP diphosphatase n=1 Tax=uncultured Desulfobacterium sp. TaxID=201089 RepID=A0A445MZR0_9BACT|nr:Phosphoribosyl-ATP diphosphatase [uncultured Desulfobacterium sp.]